MAKPGFRLALFATLLALIVVLLGAYTRLTHAGLGCPDWPGCYGFISVPKSEAQLAHAELHYPDSPVEAHKGMLSPVAFLTRWRGRRAASSTFGSIPMRPGSSMLSWPECVTTATRRSPRPMTSRAQA